MKTVKCPKCKKLIGIDVDDYWSALALGVMVFISMAIGLGLGMILN